MGPFLKIIHQSSLLANYNKIDKINSPYRKLAIKRSKFFISYAEYKIWKFLFIHHKSISSFVNLTSQKVLKMTMFKN